MNTIVMQKLGDMEEGKILNWLKKEGDTIKKGDIVAEIETEKVNIEMESFVEGTLRKILVPAGQSAPVGADIALVGDPNEPLEESAPQAPAQAAAPDRASFRRACGREWPRRAVARAPAGGPGHARRRCCGRAHLYQPDCPAHRRRA